MKIAIQDVQVFADGLDHPECVAVHADGTVWAGGEAGQVYQISKDGTSIKEVANTGGFVLGIAFSPDYTWLAVCDLKHQCVWKLDLVTLQLEVFAKGVEGCYFNIPNYPVFDSSGNLYVSESGAFRQITGKVFRFSADGYGSIWHNGPFNFANGMALSPGEDYLYVVCTWLPGVERIKILPGGDAGAREVVVTLPETCPDGIAFDKNGNLYISCYAPNTIYRYTTNNELEVLVHDWEAHSLSNPTNIAFDGNILYSANLGRWHLSKMIINDDVSSLADST